MTSTQWMQMTKHTPLKDEIRERVALSYARGDETANITGFDHVDAKVLVELGYQVISGDGRACIRL